MRKLYQEANNENVLYDMALRPLESEELKFNGITNMHVLTFTNMSK